VIIYDAIHGFDKHTIGGQRIDILRENGKCGIVFYADVRSKSNPRMDIAVETINEVVRTCSIAAMYIPVFHYYEFQTGICDVCTYNAYDCYRCVEGMFQREGIFPVAMAIVKRYTGLHCACTSTSCYNFIFVNGGFTFIVLL